MSATLQRDQACALAKTQPQQALAKARTVSDPWFRAQALSWVARFTDSDPLAVARLAARAATECHDDYQRAAVRAWEVAALAERKLLEDARRALGEAVALAAGVRPVSSRSEALFLLFQAALLIGRSDGARVLERLDALCPVDEHWRCRRSHRDAHRVMDEGAPPRSFFW